MGDPGPINIATESTMSSEAEKNPVMVAAGFKAAETRRANALARAQERAQENGHDKLAQWVTEALASADITQAELSRQLSNRLGRSVDRAAVNKLTKGQRELSAGEMLAISEITGYPLPVSQSFVGQQSRSGTRSSSVLEDRASVSALVDVISATLETKTGPFTPSVASDVASALVDAALSLDLQEPEHARSVRRSTAIALTHTFVRRQKTETAHGLPNGV